MREPLPVAVAATAKLFYDNPELFSSEATVLALTGDPVSPNVVLDRTIFYPEGGGQACDLGSIAPADGGEAIAVSAVSDRSGLVLHRLAEPCAFALGDRVRLVVDRARRTDYSQQHTAEHLVGATALRLLGARVVSVHFGSDRSYIDFDLPAISDEDLEAVENEVEELIADDYVVRYHVCPPEDIASFPLRRKAPEVEEGEALRVVEIDGIDYSACCGLHATSTGKLRAVRLFPAEKYKGMSRVYFAAGGRAAADYRALSRIARDAARTLGTSEGLVAEAVAREAERRKELEYLVVALERERAQAELERAQAEHARARADSGIADDGRPPLYVRRYVDRSASSLMTTAKAFAEAGWAALLASGPELTAQALAPANEARLGERLKPCLAAAGGKGGGGPANFRATFGEAAALERFMADAEAALRSVSDAMAP